MRLVALVLTFWSGVASAADSLSVAVLEFDVPAQAKAYADLGKGLQSMLTTDLTNIPALRLVERARLSQVRAELKLNQTALVDPATAAKVGKLVGAGHLLAGSLTVVGGKMRLDVRLFSVARGEVLLAAEVTGPEEDFWELEKQLVKRVVAALPVKPTSRERAAMARVHTADLAAFRAFSQGISAFDAADYGRATKALRTALARDSEFRLAHLTLVEYERIIGELRAKASNIEAAQRDVKRAEHARGVTELDRVLGKLLALAATKGAGQRRRRLTALYLLAAGYWGIGDVGPHRRALARSEDRFARERLGARFCQAYYAEARPLFPKVPLFVDGAFVGHLPRTPKSFEADLAKATRRLEGGGMRGRDRIEALLGNLKGPEAGRACLEVDFRTEMRQLAEHYALGLKLLPRSKSAKEDSLTAAKPKRYAPASYTWREKFGRRVAVALRRILEVGESTRMLAKLSARLREPDAIRRAAHEIAGNKAIAKVLAEHPEAPYLREMLLLVSDPAYYARRGAGGLTGAVPAQAWKVMINTERKLPAKELRFIDIGAHRVWLHSTAGYLSTGPRTDLRRADELRYAVSRGTFGNTNVLLVDGVPRDDLEVSFEVRYRYPKDFTVAGDVASVAGGLDARRRPAVGVLFGVRDLSRWAQIDVRGKLYDGLAASRAYAVVVSAKSVALLEWSRKQTRGSGHRRRWEGKTLQRFDLEAGRPRTLPVAVRVGAEETVATVGEQRFVFESPPDRGGFYGLTFLGRGYAGLGALKVQ